MATLYRQLHESKTHAQGNDPACPVCQRHIRVNAILAELGAKGVADISGPNNSDMSFYVLPNGSTFILHWYADDNGFEMYRPMSTSNRVEDTFMELTRLAHEVLV